MHTVQLCLSLHPICTPVYFALLSLGPSVMHTSFLHAGDTPGSFAGSEFAWYHGA